MQLPLIATDFEQGIQVLAAVGKIIAPQKMARSTIGRCFSHPAETQLCDRLGARQADR
jgi:hypothetical protein